MNGDLSGSCMTSMEPDLQFGHAAYPESGSRQGTYEINIAYLWGMYFSDLKFFNKSSCTLEPFRTPLYHGPPIHKTQGPSTPY